jgi:hypothetical protein
MIDEHAAWKVLSGVADSAFRSGVLIMLTAAALCVFRVGNPIARLHAWRMALIASCVLPVLSAVSPRMVAVSSAPVADLAQMAMLSPSRATPGSSPQIMPSGKDVSATTLEPPAPVAVVPPATLLIAVYAIGVATLLLRVVVGCWYCRRLRRTADPISARLLEASAVFQSAVAKVPMTIGIIRPVIVLPEDWRGWPSSMLDAVLVHESAHIRRRDQLTLARGPLSNRAVVQSRGLVVAVRGFALRRGSQRPGGTRHWCRAARIRQDNHFFRPAGRQHTARGVGSCGHRHRAVAPSPRRSDSTLDERGPDADAIFPLHCDHRGTCIGNVRYRLSGCKRGAGGFPEWSVGRFVLGSFRAAA